MTLFSDLVPSGERPVVDWHLLEDAFDWFGRLHQCPQDPIFHAEGDVGVHTRLVCEALIAGAEWPRLDTSARTSLFWAALLHDVAKPERTRTTPDGRIVAPGHSRHGQILARRILWRLGALFPQREEICHLITHHQVPFYVLERDDPERVVHAISWQTRCDLLAALAHADAEGRICADRDRLTDNVALFTELCREQNCYDAPRSFASDHSRFLYFRRHDRAPDYEAYDDWRGPVTLMSGLPGAGKDTWLAAHARGAEIVSLDDLRLELDVAPSATQGRVITAARERARDALRAGRPFLWNATNVSRATRARLINLCAAYRSKIRIVYLEASEEVLRQRNADRARPVPEAAIKRMLDHWEVPDLTECHEIIVRAN